MTQMPKEELKQLLRHKGRCVSIYMPTHQMGAEVQQDSIRLKNLLRKAEEQLLSQSVRQTEIARLLQSAQKLIKDTHFWNHQLGGLALFLSEEIERHFLSPDPFAEICVATDRFHMKPLLPLLSGDGRFYILAASKKQFRFLEGTRDTVHDIDLADVPKSLADALKFENPEKQLQFRTQAAQPRGGRSAMFHGHGGGADDSEHKKEILRFFRQVSEGVADFMKGGHAPLVFAGVEYLYPLYKEANTYPDLEGRPIPGNPDDLSSKELHEKAWELVRPHFQREQDEAAGQFRQLIGSERAVDDLKQAVIASHHGRVESLFVSLGGRVWGSFDEEHDNVEVHPERQPGDEDLLDRAALETILSAGTVYAVNPDAMPADGEIAAVLRY